MKQSTLTQLMRKDNYIMQKAIIQNEEGNLPKKRLKAAVKFEGWA